jgi:hypothetical protein
MSPDKHVKYREWQCPRVRAAATPRDYYSALCGYYGLTPGRANIPDNPRQLLWQARSIAKQPRYHTVADQAEKLTDEALRHTLRHYDPEKGSVLHLFVLNVRGRLDKAVQREAGKQTIRAVSFSEGQVEAVARKKWESARQQKAGEGFEHWASLLFELACERLDRVARAVLEEHYLAGTESRRRLEDIGDEQGVSRATLWRRYGDDRLERLLREAVTRLVTDLSCPHQRLLVRHMREEAALTDDQMETLLGVPPVDDSHAPLLDEEELLRVLGWAVPDLTYARSA